MYWRIRKITPDIFVKRFGLHAILIVSVLFNLMAMGRMNAGHAMTTQQKTDYDSFARQVTRHLLDASYMTVEESMTALTNEMSGQSLTKLRGSDFVPKDEEDLKAIARQLTDAKSVSNVKFNSVSVGDPTAQGFLPVTVRVQVVAHDTDGVRPNNLKIKYVIGLAAPKNDPKSVHPVVLDLDMQPDQS